MCAQIVTRFERAHAKPQRPLALCPLLIALLSASACGTSPEDATSERSDGDETNTNETTGGDTGGATPEVASSALWGDDCVPSEQWRIDNRPAWNDPAVFEFSANNGLLWLSHFGLWEGAVARATDGELLSTASEDGIVAVDDSWLRFVRADSEGRLEVGRFIGDDARWTLPPSRPGWSNQAAALSANGQLVAHTQCDQDPDNSERAFLRVAVLETEDGQSLRELTIEAPAMTCYTYGDHTLLRFVGDDLIVVPPVHGSAWLLDAEGTATGPFPLVESSDPSVPADVIELLAPPSGDRVFVTGSDGIVRSWRFPSFDNSVELGVVQLGTMNQFTYAPPVVVAPIAVSRDGSLVAWASDRREIVVADVAGNELHRVMVEVAPDEFGAPAEYDMIGRVTLSRDGGSLAVLHSGGISTWACAPHTASGAAVRSVTLDAPERAVVGSEVTLLATHAGGTSVHAHRFYIDDELVAARVLERSFVWTPTEAGRFVVRVVVDDGAAEVEASREIEVLR